MSIRVMSRVWDHSAQVGGPLLLLLALADFADDDGYCWPKQANLATKARCSVRAVRYQLERLTAAGEIERSDGRGRGVGSVYRILTGLAQTTKPAEIAAFTPDKKRQSATKKAAIAGTQNRQSATKKAAIQCRPIENRQEPSLTTPVREPSKALKRAAHPEEGPFRAREAPPPDGPPLRLAAPARIDDGIPDGAIPPDLLAAFLDGCGLDSDLSPAKHLQEARYWAYTLAKRRPAFTASEVKAAARNWHRKFPDREPKDILPPHPEQLAHWTSYRRAGKAQQRAISQSRERAASGAGAERRGHSLVPCVER